jgi:two-component system, response regulator
VVASEKGGFDMGDGTILMTDDDPRTAEMFGLVLRANGIDNEVVVARDGVEALDYLFGTGDHAGSDTSFMPRFMLLDLSMPRMGGLEVLRRLRDDERTKLLPVVVLTSSTVPQDIVEAYRAGANGYVNKLSNAPWPELVLLIARYWLDMNVSARGGYPTA